MIIMEFELKHDTIHPLYPVGDPDPLQTPAGGELDGAPTVEDIMESTTSGSKPLPALERLRLASDNKPAVSNTQPPPFSRAISARSSRRIRSLAVSPHSSRSSSE
jgi:hypothetical protein